MIIRNCPYMTLKGSPLKTQTCSLGLSKNRGYERSEHPRKGAVWELQTPKGCQSTAGGEA